MIAIILGSRSALAAVVPPDQWVEGKSYSEWHVAFWQWFLETPYNSSHPANDYTGAHALRGQSGPVWFLVPASTPGPITRSIAIPDDRWLLMLISGSTCSTIDLDPYRGSNEEEVRTCASSFGIAADPYLEIDGQTVSDLERFDAISPLFDFTYPPVNIGFVPGGGTGQGIGHGINVILEPLTPGSHVIHFRASQPAENFSNDVTYNITVYRRPPLSIRQIPEASQVEISWPDTSGFSLQATEQLTSDGPWSNVSLTSSTVTDGTRSVRVAIDQSGQYFRLYRP